VASLLFALSLSAGLSVPVIEWRGRRLQAPAWAAAAAAFVLTLSSCSLLGGTVGPESVAEQFVTALGEGDVAAAAAMTDDPPAAAETVARVFEGLGHPPLDVEVQGVTDGAFTYQATWDLGRERPWSYTAGGSLLRDGDEWRVHWVPSVLHESLRPGDGLELRSVRPAAARVLDRDGQPLIRTQAVTLVRVDPTQTPDLGRTLDALAPVLARVDPGVTSASLRRDVPADRRDPFTVITLREEDMVRIGPALRAVPGVVLAAQERLLTEHDVSSPALAGLVQEQPGLPEAGWQVAVVDKDGNFRTSVAGQDPDPTPDLVLTLDRGAQIAAQNALGGLDEPAALVAMRPSTGEVLAVAQNPAADADGPIALTGLYPPGSTFKVVTAAAALQAGAAAVDTPLPCPGTENVRGRQIPNDDQFDLGTVPLHTAFAHSCNTTFARLAADLEPRALSRVATSLGLGTDWNVPGMTTVTGRVPDPSSPAEQVEASIGQGRVVASPFGMAMVAATLVEGRTPSPTLITGQPGTTAGTAEPEPLSDDLRADLAAMMRETVTGGSATLLADMPDVAGKTGTAQFGDGTHSHGWFIGTRDDLAFAVLVVGGGSSRPAVAAAKDYLSAVPSP
jgi:hypothetical protein